ncbi:MAG: hypothetical protein AB7P40_11380 [Chloroflexota bacterium]
MTQMFNPVEIAIRLVGDSVRAVNLAVGRAAGTDLPRVWYVDAEAGAYWLVEDGRFAELYAREPEDYSSWVMDMPQGALDAATEFRRRRLERRQQTDGDVRDVRAPRRTRGGEQTARTQRASAARTDGTRHRAG